MPKMRPSADTTHQSSDEFAALSARMTAELERNPSYLPSAFWQEINDKNIHMLVAEGIDNFKRTISHNYYSWLIMNPLTQQFRYLLLNWLKHPTLRPLLTRIERNLSVRVTTRPDPFPLTALQRFLYRIY